MFVSHNDSLTPSIQLQKLRTSKTPCLTVFADHSKAVFLLCFSLLLLFFFFDWHRRSSCFYKSSLVYCRELSPGTISLTGSVVTTVNITHLCDISNSTSVQKTLSSVKIAE